MLPQELNRHGGWLGGGQKELLVCGHTINTLSGVGGLKCLSEVQDASRVHGYWSTLTIS